MKIQNLQKKIELNSITKEELEFLVDQIDKWKNRIAQKVNW